MNPLATAIIAISGMVMFVSTVFLATSTPVPFFGAQDTDEIVDFEFSGLGGNITLYDEGTPTRGWAVYTYGDYIDENEDGLWDVCEPVEISIWNPSNENSTNDTGWRNFFPMCQQGFERNDVQEMVYLGQLCFDPHNEDSPRCPVGNYTLESNTFVRISQESEPRDKTILSNIIGWIESGLETGRTFLCGSSLLLLAGLILNFFSKEDQGIDITKKDGKKAEWRAYALSQTERGDDGLPKAFSRHTTQKSIYRKPRKGNRRGGVHKTGGLYLGGWTEEDSDMEYKKKVEDRRDR